MLTEPVAALPRCSVAELVNATLLDEQIGETFCCGPFAIVGPGSQLIYATMLGEDGGELLRGPARATSAGGLATRAKFGRPAMFAEEAYRLLGIADPGARDRLQPGLTAVLDTLGSARTKAVDAAWNELVAAVGTESQRDFRKKHYRYTRAPRLAPCLPAARHPRTGPGPDRAPGQRRRVGRCRRLLDGLGQGCPAYRPRPVEQQPPDPLRRADPGHVHDRHGLTVLSRVPKPRSLPVPPGAS